MLWGLLSACVGVEMETVIDILEGHLVSGFCKLLVCGVLGVVFLEKNCMVFGAVVQHFCSRNCNNLCAI